MFEQVPENVALRTFTRINLAGGKLTTRVPDQRLSVTKRDAIVRDHPAQLIVE